MAAVDATVGLGSSGPYRKRGSRTPRSRIPTPSTPLISSGSTINASTRIPNESQAKKVARAMRVRSYKMVDYTYFGEVSIPGVTNLYFSVVNIWNALSMIGTGIVSVSGEFIADGMLKFSAALVTLVHAAAQLIVMLAPIIHHIDEVYQSLGKFIHHFIRVGGVVISAIEIVCKTWQLIRQFMFDRDFEYRDIFHTEFELSGTMVCEVEAKFQEWKTLISGSEKSIVSFMGQEAFDECQSALEGLEGQYDRKLREMERLQRKLKRKWLNRNFTIMHDKYFDMSGKTDQEYIKSFGSTPEEQELGESRLANHKLMTVYRRVQSPALAARLNNFLVPKGRAVDGRFVTRKNAKEAATIFKNIEIKSRQIKIIHAVALAGLVLVCISFILLTAGVGTAVMAPLIFWTGWTLAMGASVFEVCAIPCLKEKEGDRSFDWHYLIPLKYRKKYFPHEPSSCKVPNLPQRINRKGIVRKAVQHPVIGRLAHDTRASG